MSDDTHDMRSGVSMARALIRVFIADSRKYGPVDAIDLEKLTRADIHAMRSGVSMARALIRVFMADNRKHGPADAIDLEKLTRADEMLTLVLQDAPGVKL